jgi:hypothetical protein
MQDMMNEKAVVKRTIGHLGIMAGVDQKVPRCSPRGTGNQLGGHPVGDSGRSLQADVWSEGDAGPTTSDLHPLYAHVPLSAQNVVVSQSVTIDQVCWSRCVFACLESQLLITSSKMLLGKR